MQYTSTRIRIKKHTGRYKNLKGIHLNHYVRQSQSNPLVKVDNTVNVYFLRNTYFCIFHAGPYVPKKYNMIKNKKYH